MSHVRLKLQTKYKQRHKAEGNENAIATDKCNLFTAMIQSEFTVKWKKSLERKAVKQPRTKLKNKNKINKLLKKCFWPLA